MAQHSVFVHQDHDYMWRLYFADHNGRVRWMSVRSFFFKKDADKELMSVLPELTPANDT